MWSLVKLIEARTLAVILREAGRALLQLGCVHGGWKKGAAPSGVDGEPLGAASDAGHVIPRGPVAARSHYVGTIARRALGPYTARAADGGLVAWSVPANRGGGEEPVVVPPGRDAAPL